MMRPVPGPGQCRRSEGVRRLCSAERRDPGPEGLAGGISGNPRARSRREGLPGARSRSGGAALGRDRETPFPQGQGDRGLGWSCLWPPFPWEEREITGAQMRGLPKQTPSSQLLPPARPHHATETRFPVTHLCARSPKQF